MEKEFKLGDVLKFITMPDGSIYRLVEVYLVFYEAVPSVHVHICGWRSRDDFDRGLGPQIYDARIPLNVEGNNTIKDLYEDLAQMVIAQVPYFTNALNENDAFCGKCSICGIVMNSLEEEATHLSHKCGVCDEEWWEGDHTEHDGYPVPSNYY